MAATRLSPFKVGDNQRLERTMTGVRKPPPESSVPGDNLTWGSRRNQLRRGHGSPPVLSEVPHELSIPMRTPKSANGPRSNSFRPDSPPHDNLQPGMEDSVSPLTTPDMVRSGRVLQPQLNLYFSDSDPSELLLGIQGHAAINKEDLTPQAVRSFFLLYSYKRGERRRLHCSLKRMSSPLAS